MTRWLDRLTHFDISIQHIAGSNLKFTDYLGRNPVGGPIPEENYDEEYVINILTEQAELNLKYGQKFANQSESSKIKAETGNGTSEEQIEKIDNQSHSNRTFEKDYGVDKIQQSENNTSGQSDISTPSSSCLPEENSKIVQNKIKSDLHMEFTEIDRDNFHHWGATRELMDIIRRQNNSPETSRLVEQRSTLSRPGTLRRRYDHQTQRTVFVSTRPNKRSREETAEIDAELLRRANRLGG